MEKNGMHIIDLNKTKAKLDQALLGLKKIAKTGRKILFVATKKQSKFVLEKYIKNVNFNSDFLNYFLTNEIKLT